MDCTLRELSHYIATDLNDLLPSPPIGTRLNFRVVFPDVKYSRTNSQGPGRYTSRELGSVVIGSGLSSSNNENVNPNSNGGGNTQWETLTDSQKEMVRGGVLAGDCEGSPEKTIQHIKFNIGDYIECAIIPPLSNGDIALLSEMPTNSQSNSNHTPVYSLAGAGGIRGSVRNGSGGGGNDFIHPSRAGRIEGASGWRSGQGEFGGGRAGASGGSNENGFGGFRANGGGGGFRGGARGGGNVGYGRDDVPVGEWRRGERLPDAPPPPRGGRDYGYGRGRGGGRW